jgi:hypothetical protein
MRAKDRAKRTEKTLANSHPLAGKLKAEWKGYINYEWSDAAKERFAVWLDETNLFSELDAHAAKGRKFTQGFDAYHKCMVATCFERDETSANAGYIVTARGIDATTAFARLLYLISEEMPHEWSKPSVIANEDKW